MGFIATVQGRPNRFLVGVETEVRLVSWDGVSTTTQSQMKIDAESNTNHVHDSKVDGSDRIYATSIRN